ncbi:MAG: hypothetical protein ACJ8BW_30275 [Ktedonobacteraceae bacterium]
MESELRRLLEQIEEEYNAVYSGMSAFSSGAARHAFIKARMKNIDTYRIELTTLVEEEALRLRVQGKDEGNNQGNKP